MSILDSDRKKIYGLDKSIVNHWSGQVAIVDSYSSANEIDCKDYNTMQITVSSSTEDAELILTGYYNDDRNSRYQGVIPVIEVTDFAANIITTGFPVATGLVRTFLVDVSRFYKIAFGKLTESGSVTLSYALDQTMRAFDLIGKNIVTSSIDENFDALMTSIYNKEEFTVFPVSANQYYNGTQLDTSAANSYRFIFDVATVPFSITTINGWRDNAKAPEPIDKIYIRQLNQYTRKNGFIPIGVWEVVVDTSDFESIQMVGMAVGGVIKVSGRPSNQVLEVSDKRVTIQYRYNQISARSNNDWIKVPEWAKYGKIRIDVPVNESSTITPYSAPENVNYPTTATPDGYARIYPVDEVSLIKQDGANIPVNESSFSFVFDTIGIGYVSTEIGATTNGTGINVYFEFYSEPLPDIIQNILRPSSSSLVSVQEYDVLNSTDLEKFFTSDAVDMYIWNSSSITQLRGVIHNNYCWSNPTTLYLSITGINGNIESIALNSTNFPNLLENSTIAKVIMMPWTRNPAGRFSSKEWRMNVITNRGQIYHNFPSRAVDGDGTALADDYKTFDESCAWELPERWTPVKTTTGDDATLIATGKYKYFPSLPDNSYELHPAVSQDNGFGNGGFGATVDKINELNETITFGRYWRPNNLSSEDNSFDYMGGFAPNEKLTMLGTYRSNTTQGTRMCVFVTNDGGRNWFCRYEFGATGNIINSLDEYVTSPSKNWTHQLALVGTASSGGYQVRRRLQYTPDSATKEPTKKFKHDTLFDVSSIVGTTEKIIVTTSTASNIADGDVVCFDKLTGNATWDWIENVGYGDNSAGNGVYFKAKFISTTSFELMSMVHNPHNNLASRHIHTINKNKDGYVIGTGETYPFGWIIYCPVIASDAWYRKYPWDTLEFIRLTSTRESIQRPLGVQIMQDADNTVFIGVDNENTDIGEVSLPTGRTATFRRSSNGLWKGKLVDVDSQAAFECIFPSPEVCYFFKEILGVMIYIGQLGHIGISYDKGKTWTESRIPVHMRGELSHYGGVSTDKRIVIDNILLKLKK